MDELWLTHGHLVTPRGIVDGAVQMVRGRIGAVRLKAPRGVRAVNLHRAYLAPGFVDLHVWGDPRTVSRESVTQGTTAFLTTVGPEPPARLADDVKARAAPFDVGGARCLGLHLEGPFVNPIRAGALPRRWMRLPTIQELSRLTRLSAGRLKLVTLAPELPGAMEVIRWCSRHGIVVSLGHSDADGATAARAVNSGARAVTHMFNGMRPFHHRNPSLVDVALTHPRVAAMVIADGIHVSQTALRLLLRTKGPGAVALVTDSVRHQGWPVRERGGAYYTRRGVLAGSHLTMIQAVRNAVLLGSASLSEAVRMASEVPTKLLRLLDSSGTLALGKRADLVAFTREFRVVMTMVGGRIVYRHGV